MTHLGFKESCENYLGFHYVIIVIYFEFSLWADIFVGGDAAQTNFLGKILRCTEPIHVLELDEEEQHSK